MTGCQYTGCTNEADYYCTDVHEDRCHEHIYMDEESE